MAITDNDFSESSIDSPAAHAKVVTPADDVDLTKTTRAIYVGVGGNLAVKMRGIEGDSIVTFVGVPTGALLPIRVREVRATSTTATNIVAIW